VTWTLGVRATALAPAGRAAGGGTPATPGRGGGGQHATATPFSPSTPTATIAVFPGLAGPAAGFCRGGDCRFRRPGRRGRVSGRLRAAAACAGSAGIETRVFVPELVPDEINSRRAQPGVAYHMGIGFATGRVPQAVAPILADLGRRADPERTGPSSTGSMPISIPVGPSTMSATCWPLTPAGKPDGSGTWWPLTSRTAGRAGDRSRRLAGPASWGGTRGRRCAAAMQNPAGFQNPGPGQTDEAGRRRLCGARVGHGSPRWRPFHTLIQACGALPCLPGWTGCPAARTGHRGAAGVGLSQGRGRTGTSSLTATGTVADPGPAPGLRCRTWYRIVELARDLDLPLNVGHRDEQLRQRLADDFDAAELAPLRPAFLDGAAMIWRPHRAAGAPRPGLSRASGRPALCRGRRERNTFYTPASPPGAAGRAGQVALGALPRDPEPEQVLASLGPQESSGEDVDD